MQSPLLVGSQIDGSSEYAEGKRTEKKTGAWPSDLPKIGKCTLIRILPCRGSIWAVTLTLLPRPNAVELCRQPDIHVGLGKDRLESLALALQDP